MKECKKCREIKPLNEFYTAKATKDGLMTECKSCNKKKVAKYQKRTGYEKKRDRYNFKRIFRQRYHGMKRRVDGEIYQHSTSMGKEILSQKQFLDWCNQEEVLATFTSLHDKWVESNFSFALVPTIDRIDNNKGYTPNNIQWLTKQDNSKKWNK